MEEEEEEEERRMLMGCYGDEGCYGRNGRLVIEQWKVLIVGSTASLPLSCIMCCIHFVFSIRGLCAELSPTVLDSFSPFA